MKNDIQIDIKIDYNQMNVRIGCIWVNIRVN